MDIQAMLAITQLALTLAANFHGGAKLKNVATLEAMAAAIAQAYQQEAGKPIDPAIFTVEAPL